MTNHSGKKISTYSFWIVFSLSICIGLIWPQTNYSPLYEAVLYLLILGSILTYTFFDARCNGKSLSPWFFAGIALFHPLFLPIYMVKTRGLSLGLKWVIQIAAIFIGLFVVIVLFFTTLKIIGVLPRQSVF